MTLPTFIVIGVAKAGTTSVYHYLDQHPQVYMYPLKATNYFGYEDALDWRWPEEGAAPRHRNFHVRTFEDYERAFADATDELAVGEVSPQYIRCPTAAGKIAAVLPDVKLIALLRNPADRAFSGFLMRTRRGEPVGSAREELTPDSSHVRESLYFQKFSRYFEAFPREQIKVYLFDEFKKDPTAIMRDVFSFIGVDAGFTPDTSTQHNPANVPRSRLVNRVFYHPYTIRATKAVVPERRLDWAKRIRNLNLEDPPKFSEDLRADLLDHYREDILNLQELLDLDLSVWLEPATVSRTGAV